MGKMLNINFDDGWETMSINGDEGRLIRWNPKDPNLMERFMDFQNWVSSDLGKVMEKYESIDFSMDEDGELISNLLNKNEMSNIGNQIGEQFNKLFGSEVDEAIFMGANPLTPNNGQPIFLNFLEAIMPIIEQSVEKENKVSKEYIKQASVYKKHQGR